MKTIKYKIKQYDTLLDVAIGYNETNLETAKKEAFNGEYTIVEETEQSDDV